jgi:3-oxoadipate enol-lactonase
VHFGRLIVTPVVLLHPLALSGAVWDPFIGGLAERFKVLTPDSRGHGTSAWDGHEFTVTDLAADAAALIESLDAGPAHVIGLSMGGCTAILLAADRPDLVDRLVLANTTASYGPHRIRSWAGRAHTAELTPRAQQLPFQRERWFSPAFQRSRPHEVDRVSRIFAATDSRAHAATCRALGRFEAANRLADVRAPTLVLVGADDFATPPEMAAHLAAGIDGARLRVLEATRHLSLIERPDVWPDLTAFLDGCGAVRWMA